MPEQGPTLEQLVAAGAYNPQLVAPLEQYVYEQVSREMQFLWYFFSISEILMYRVPCTLDPCTTTDPNSKFRKLARKSKCILFTCMLLSWRYNVPF